MKTENQPINTEKESIRRGGTTFYRVATVSSETRNTSQGASMGGILSSFSEREVPVFTTQIGDITIVYAKEK